MGTALMLPKVAPASAKHRAGAPGDEYLQEAGQVLGFFLGGEAENGTALGGRGRNERRIGPNRGMETGVDSAAESVLPT